MVANAERELRMMVVHVRAQGGFFVAMVPAHLNQEQIEAALEEIGITADAVLELSGWMTAKCSVAVAHVPQLNL